MDEALTGEVVPQSTPSKTSSRQGILSGVRTVGLMTLLSRVLGMVRDMAMAAVFGAGAALDAFTLAFRAPNLARRLFGEGAFTSAFLPSFVRQIETRNRAAASELANVVFWRLARWLVVLTIAAESAVLLPLYFTDLGSETRLLLKLLALLIPYVILVCLTAHQSAVLHSVQRFALPAFLPVLLNVVWLLGLGAIVLLISPVGDSRLLWLCGVILLAGIVQLGASLWSTRSVGWGVSWAATDHSSAGDEVFRTMWPVVIGMSVTQLNTLVDSLLAWWLSIEGTGLGWLPHLPQGTASALYLGQRLQQFPLGVIGVSIGTVLFPRLSRHVAGGALSAVRDDISWGLRFTIAICLPASFGLMILARPITEVLFQRGEFDAADVTLTSQMVAAYGLSVWASVALLIIHRGFYSLEDRLTPLRISMWLMAANLVLNLILVRLLLGVGLAWATTATSMGHAVIALAILQRRIGRIDWTPASIVLAKTTAGSAGMWGACLVVQMAWPSVDSTWLAALRLLAIMTAGATAYLSIAAILRLDEATSVIRDRKSL